MKEQIEKLYIQALIDDLPPNVFANQILRLFEVSGISIPKPPEPPPSRVLREGVGHFCTNCGSTSSKVGLFGLVGERLCDNKKCPNSKSKKNYL